jgi:two-component system, cell cycle response regulator DivK
MTGKRGLLVLIVDDNERNAKLARDVLRASGLLTIEAASGTEAFDRAVRGRPDVILLDIRLPDMDGEDVARQLKADPRTAHIPVVAVTSLPLQGQDRWLLEAGFDGSIEKPIDVRAFPNEVRRFVHGAEDR